MIEPTLSSTNPSQNAEAEPLKENLQSVKNEDTWLSDIPLLGSTESALKTKESLSSSEPSSCEESVNHEEIVEGKFEYEFSCLFDGALCFVHLYDTSDVSACERVVHRPVRPNEITYSPTTGNGFVEDPPFKHTFTKQPYKRTWTTPIDIKAGVRHENTVARRQAKHVGTAEDILSSL